MPDPDEQQAAAQKPKRGEAAWKAAKEAVAERNERARKTAKKDRQAHDREMVERRQRLI